ncbi:MAG: hypothetical protein ACLGPM_07860 [Acidobacteriota bacterium]
MPGIVEEILTEKRKDIVREMIQIAKDQRRMIELLDALAEVDLHLKARYAPASGKYAAFASPIEAVVRYLEDRKTASSRSEIAKAVVEGGFRGGGREQELAVRRSIGVFLKGTGAQTKTLREMNGLVGLYDWEDVRFSG